LSQSVTYYGLDLGEYYSQLSYYNEEMQEPVSISTIVGCEKYLVPTLVGKKKDYMQWYIGEEAEVMPIKVDNLLSRAMKRENVNLNGDLFQALDLLAVFIRRMFQLSGTVLPHKDSDLYVICVDHASHLAVETLLEACESIGIPKERVKICSRQECFCYYVMHQEKSLRIHDVLLLDYWRGSFKVYQLTQDRTVTPVVVSVKEMQLLEMSNISDESIDKDQLLYAALDDILALGIVSSIYLVGDGFDGDWLNKSLARMCAGRRVFGGKNLYTKGACYYGQVSRRGLEKKADYLYLGGGNVLSNVCILGKNENGACHKVLIPAGYNWQDARGSEELLFRKKADEEPKELVIPLLIRSLNGEEKTVDLTLSGCMLKKDMPKRMRMNAQAVSTTKVKIQVEDLGFGQLCESNHKIWDFELRI